MLVSKSSVILISVSVALTSPISAQDNNTQNASINEIKLAKAQEKAAKKARKKAEKAKRRAERANRPKCYAESTTGSRVKKEIPC